MKYAVNPGELIPTFFNPEGAYVQVKIAPLIADSPARAEVGGFLSHAANLLCSFCLCTKDDLENLDLESWEPRSGIQVRSEGEAWRSMETKAARLAQEQKTGVRWSSLYLLPYWDPVNHVVLGFMHNWLEGVLQHHLRTLWGIGRDQTKEDKVTEMQKDEQWDETDISDSADEVEELQRELEEYESSDRSMTIDSESTTPTPNLYNLNINDNDGDGDDDDYIPLADTSIFSFTESQLDMIHTCIKLVSLPTWVQRPPVNLGDASHGKLKAQEYLTLFSVILPLIIPELWHFPLASDNDLQNLECFYHLVVTTNIICSFQTSNEEADVYTQHYVQYRTIIQDLFHHWPALPNHHWALHNGALLKNWGPLPSVSEFPGERLNGMLQKIKTNRQLRKSDLCESNSKLQSN